MRFVAVFIEYRIRVVHVDEDLRGRFRDPAAKASIGPEIECVPSGGAVRPHPESGSTRRLSKMCHRITANRNSRDVRTRGSMTVLPNVHKILLRMRIGVAAQHASSRGSEEASWLTRNADSCRRLKGKHRYLSSIHSQTRSRTPCGVHFIQTIWLPNMAKYIVLMMIFRSRRRIHPQRLRLPQQIRPSSGQVRAGGVERNGCLSSFALGWSFGKARFAWRDRRGA